MALVGVLNGIWCLRVSCFLRLLTARPGKEKLSAMKAALHAAAMDQRV
jgi:ABC-type thiamin/hydroxymethylpyrimidine transport system permease subunit